MPSVPQLLSNITRISTQACKPPTQAALTDGFTLGLRRAWRHLKHPGSRGPLGIVAMCSARAAGHSSRLLTRFPLVLHPPLPSSDAGCFRLWGGGRRQALNLVGPWGPLGLREAVCVAGVGWLVWLLHKSPQERELSCTTTPGRHLRRRGSAPRWGVGRP